MNCRHCGKVLLIERVVNTPIGEARDVYCTGCGPLPRLHLCDLIEDLFTKEIMERYAAQDVVILD